MNFSPAWLILLKLALALIGACFTRQPMNAKMPARAPGAFIRVRYAGCTSNFERT